MIQGIQMPEINLISIPLISKYQNGAKVCGACPY
jgi:hypothetical protein